MSGLVFSAVDASGDLPAVFAVAGSSGLIAAGFGPLPSSFSSASRDDVRLGPVVSALLGALKGSEPSGEFLLEPKPSSPFEAAVVAALRQVPAGSTITYKELAVKAGYPLAWRATGSVLSGNRFAVLIPCHRVVPSSGGVGAYRWGERVKAALLRAEGAPGFA